MSSPLLPYLSENVYRGLTGEESVHLSNWPDPSSLSEDAELVRGMDRVRDVCSAALALRRSHDVRVRQPLRRLVVAGPDATALAEYADLIQDEVNVKEVAFQADIEAFASFKLKVNARALGPRLGSGMKTVLAAAKAGDWESDASGEVRVAGELLQESEYQLLLEPAEGVDCQALPGNDMICVLDFDLDDELIAEGYARDVVRVVQQARRDEGLHISDRIALRVSLPAEWDGLENFSDWISEQTLASDLRFVGDLSAEAGSAHEGQVGGETIRLRLARAS